MPEGFILATLHRAENTDNPVRLKNIVDGLNRVHEEVAPVVMPLHPRTRGVLAKQGLTAQFNLVDPVGYLEMIWLLQRAGLVMTDSGGVQKEAYFFGKPCVTMRDQTEWVELLDVGANELVGAEKEKVLDAARSNYGRRIQDEHQLYGGGLAARQIINALCE